jgi:hypothetical protein
MFSTLRNRFGIPGVISVIALVFAMFGGAYAASNSSSGPKATASAKAKQGPRGKTGKTGPAGPQGPAGPAGPAGAKGDVGAPGSNGTNGAPGADGKSVIGEPIASGGACGEGVTGVKYTLNAVSTPVCNGKDAFTEFVLPSEATETGTFSFQGEDKELEVSPIAFPIPLSPAAAAAITANFWQESNPASQPDACPGTPEAPTAEPGAICFYVPTVLEGNQITSCCPSVVKDVGGAHPGVNPSGAFFRTEFGAENAQLGGFFAVTAP